jgi:hypothetical protein
MRRRSFITLLGGAAAWPLGARAQQPAMPVIGVINSGTSTASAKNVTALHQALKEAGFVEGQNVAIEFRWAENQFDRLRGLVSDLIGLPVAVNLGCPFNVRFTSKTRHQNGSDYVRAVRPAAWRYSLRLIGVGNFAARGCKAC